MNITNKLIETFDPCEDGILDFNTKYPNYNDTLINLLQLDNISYDNKIWLVGKVVDTEILRRWSFGCADSVQHIYNNMYTNDNRISECIRINKLYLDGKCSLDELKSASYSASSAASAARSSSWSAAHSAHSAASAAAAAYSTGEASAESAVYSSATAYSSVYSKTKQQQLNLDILIKLLGDEHVNN